MPAVAPQAALCGLSPGRTDCPQTSLSNVEEKYMSHHWGITAYFLASVQGDRGAGLSAFLSAEKWKCNVAKKPHSIND